MEIVYIGIAIILGLGLLVLVHEWGHFIVARWAGVRVETFSIGFGRHIASFQRGETLYKIGWIPLGGYVKMTGEDPQDVSSADDPAAYANKPVWRRMAIVLAGPIMNVGLAAIIMPLTFMMGREQPAYELQPPVIEQVRARSGAAIAGIDPGDIILAVDGRAVETWEDVQEGMVLAGREDITVRVSRWGALLDYTVPVTQWGRGFHPAAFLGNAPVVDAVVADGPADVAGIQAGDHVVAIAGQPIAYWDELSLAISHGRSLWFWLWAHRTFQGDFRQTQTFLRGGPLTLGVDRAGRRLDFAVTPQFDAGHDRLLIGIRHDPEVAYKAIPKIMRRFGFVESIIRGEKELWRLARITGGFLGRLVRAPQAHYESLGGPVRIISMFAKIAQEGVSPFLYFLCFFSLQLGLLNLLPIPVLDGGHMVFLICEGLRRRPLTLRFRMVAQQIGLVLLLSIFAIVTFNDLGHFEWVRRLVGTLF
jgi:regulator of sigma E protease